MTKNTESNPSDKEITPYQPLSNQTNSDIDNFTQSLVERANNAENIEEIKQIPNIIASIEAIKQERLNQEGFKLQLEQTSKKLEFRRKQELLKNISKIVFSGVSILIGFVIPFTFAAKSSHIKSKYLKFSCRNSTNFTSISQ